MTIKVLSENNQVSYNFFDEFEIMISVLENKYNFKPDDLFEVALRNNPKRSFLFVSKLLGKHLPVEPNIPRFAGNILASIFKNEFLGGSVDVQNQMACLKKNNFKFLNLGELSEKTLFIGFAETATGLAHAVASSFRKNTHYIQTSREKVLNIDKLFECQEVHSHDVDHYLFSRTYDIMKHVKNVVIIDDEITTGQTALNLIKNINEKYQYINFFLLSILDFRSDIDIEKQKNFCMRNNIKLEYVTMLRAKFDIIKDIVDYDSKTRDIQEFTIKNCSYESLNIKFGPRVSYKYFAKNNEILIKKNLIHSGKFGINNKELIECEDYCKSAARQLKNKIITGKTLCLGFNEFIYIPSRIASYLGKDVYFHSTTRSPIKSFNMDKYCIKSKYAFGNPFDTLVTNYIYNFRHNNYENVLIFNEENIGDYHKKNITENIISESIKQVIFVELVDSSI